MQTSLSSAPCIDGFMPQRRRTKPVDSDVQNNTRKVEIGSESITGYSLLRRPEPDDSVLSGRLRFVSETSHDDVELLTVKPIQKDSEIFRANISARLEMAKNREASSYRLAKLCGGSMIIIVLLLSGLQLLQMRTNVALAARISASEAAAAKSTADSAALAESTTLEVRIPKQGVENYAVAPTSPRLISIDALGVEGRVLPMSQDKGQKPPAKNIFDAGWYTQSARPGQGGAMVIESYANGRIKKGLFANIETLKIGNTVKVERGDGAKLIYVVQKIENMAADNLAASTLTVPYGGATQGLNLVARTGVYDSSTNNHSDRTVVYTTLQKIVR